MTDSSESDDFNRLKAASCAVPQMKVHFFRRSGSVIVAYSLMKRLQKFVSPRNDLTSVAFVGRSMALMASIFECSGEIPLADSR